MTEQPVDSTPSPSPPPFDRPRLLSLDVFRGMTVAGMLLVNNPGDWGSIYPPLRHAAWHGWTPTDLIFPFFLFIVGITTHLSMTARRARGASEAELTRQILRRGLLIILFGLLLNSFPFFAWSSKLEGLSDPTFLQRVLYRFTHLRYLGVLQRIGIVYIASALLARRATPRQIVLIVSALLLGYWFAMTLLPVPGTGQLGGALLDSPEANLAAYVDRAILGPGHTWKPSWDPEGPLSTIPAIATALLGILAGRWIGSPRSLPERLNGLFAAGAIGMVTGLIWHWSFPINKNLWTSSYVIFTAGMACVALASCIWLIDEKGLRSWTKFFEVFGVNPIVAFVGSGLMARIVSSLIKVPLDGKRMSLQGAIYQWLYVPVGPPRVASLLFALSFVLLWFGILYVLYRRRIFLKV